MRWVATWSLVIVAAVTLAGCATQASIKPIVCQMIMPGLMGCIDAEEYRQMFEDEKKGPPERSHL